MDTSQSSFASTPHGSQASTTTAFSLPISTSSFSASSFPGLSQETTSSTSTLVDPNSPELFRQNIQIAMEQVAQVNALARNALNGIQNAYHSGVNPTQTQADLIALDQALHTLANMLRQSGVGAYPLSAPDTRNVNPPTEQQLIADTTRNVQQLYEEFKRMQESSSVVANLLSAPEGVGRPKV